MTSLEKLYGKNYSEKGHNDKIETIVNLLSNNLSHRYFIFKSDNNILFTNHKINLNILILIKNKVEMLNKHLLVNHINDTKLLNTLIQGVPVEYFIIVDKEYKKTYNIYITINDVGIL